MSVNAAAHMVPKVSPNAKDVALIHFVEDGFSAFGKVWFRGEELAVDRESPAYASTLDVYEESWMTLSEAEQISRWGHVKFRQGEWQGASFDLEDPALTEADRKVLEQAAAQKKAAAKSSGKKATKDDDSGSTSDPFLEDLNS